MFTASLLIIPVAVVLATIVGFRHTDPHYNADGAITRAGSHFSLRDVYTRPLDFFTGPWE